MSTSRRRCYCLLFHIASLLFFLHCDTEAKKTRTVESKTPAAATVSHSGQAPIDESGSATGAELQTLSGKFAADTKQGFAVIPAKYLNGKPQYLDERALAALLKLAAAAHSAGYDIKVISATRNFTTQKAIWEEKFTGKRAVGGKNLATTVKNDEARALEILRFSSMPGTSRHHWGTDLDLHELKITGPALHNSTFKQGRGKEFYEWLVANAAEFGFCQPYDGDPSMRNGGKYAHGYQEERWHWSYRPVSADYLKSYQQNAAALQPKGYAGDAAAAHLYMDYVQNIDPSCR